MAFSGSSVSIPQQNQTISDFEQPQSQTEQQHQQQHSQQTFGSNDLQATFASSQVPAANPPFEVDRRSSASTQGQGPHSWQNSPASNQAEGLASPISSVISPHNNTNPPKLPPIDPLVFDSASETKPSLPIEAIESPKRRRGRPRISEDDGLDVVAPKTGAEARQKGSTRRASNTSTSGAIGTGDKRSGAEAKKNKIRARNREAAYKCRKKKQKGVEELQTQEAMAENINKNLNDEAALLRGEILMLKTMVLQHGSCGCSFIEEYISGAAQNLVSSSMAGGASAPASGGGGMQMDNLPCPNGTNEGESYVDWKMFDVDAEQGVPSMGAEHS
ncbi:bZIP transcription factor [Colletotrichum costaricense]|uniref:BZIP transcription factor n=1 Tax=Colletotrichum costaricense TaxID=1209916 RepID=A0AAI9YTQ0_9PEZI|nr:bZIP transcription factor [Colletotrichum costaricense]KAK1523779.1 bZIP transcription factor [Colletotrichum costaricense]